MAGGNLFVGTSSGVANQYEVTDAAPMPVRLASGAGAASSACSVTSVGDETTSTELLAANTSRKAARIVNDSTAILYVACTEAASATNYTAKLLPQEGVTITGFTGAIYGLWASDAGGSARISEFT